MLKYGAYYLFKEAVDEEKEREQDKQILAQDIDSILERAATIKYTFEDDKQKGTNAALSGFSKAHFISNEKDMEIDIHDQHFWEKIFPNQHSARSLIGRYDDGSAFLKK